MKKSGHSSRKCPPGMVFNVRMGKCVKRRQRKGIDVLEAPPEAALVMGNVMADRVVRERNVVLSWTKIKRTSPITERLNRKPLYLIRLAPNQTDGVALGIAVARNLDADTRTRITITRVFKEPRPVRFKEKPKDMVVYKHQIIFDSKAKDTLIPKDKMSRKHVQLYIGSVQEKDQLEKIRHETVGKPTSDGGAHSHSLVRREGRTFEDGRHFHVLNHPDHGMLVSDIAGGHAHTLDTDRTGDVTSAHSHVFGKPDGEIIITDIGGKHDHAILTERTAFDAPHTHNIKDGSLTLETLSANDESMMLDPGMLDGPDEEATGAQDGEDPEPRDQVEAQAPEEAADKMLDEIDTDFEKAWEAAGWLVEGLQLDEQLKEFTEKQTTVQSVVLSKQRFPTMESAKAWVESHGFKANKVDEKPNTFRFRQFPPTRCKAGTFRNKRITRGVIGTICVSKGAETPETLRSAKPGNEAAKAMQKQIVEQAKIKVDSRPTGFGFKLDGNILYAFKERPNGRPSGAILVLVERQRLDSASMARAPKGALDGMEVLLTGKGMGKKNPKRMARENMGSRIFVLEGVKGSPMLRERDVFLAVIDPTKEAPEPGTKKDCSCQDS